MIGTRNFWWLGWGNASEMQRPIRASSIESRMLLRVVYLYEIFKASGYLSCLLGVLESTICVVSIFIQMLWLKYYVVYVYRYANM